jgi:uncharacterized repeat protein (TIGR03803 family)
MNNLNILAMKKSLLLLVVVAVVAYTETHAQGTLWGSTLEGGPGNTGVIFRVGADGTGLVVERNFEIAALGQIPGSTLVEAANKKLYGVTQQGGTSDKGVLFEYDPVTGTYTKKIDFNGVGNGGYVRGGLTIGNNNKLYGITVLGGSSDFGVLFEYDFVTGILTKKIDFNGTANGSYPYGSLTMGSNNKLYGVTVFGGTSNFGVLFEYDPATSTLTKKIDFNGTVIGRLPYEGLTLGSNGKFYGTTLLGGASNKGVLFEYESATGNLTKKFDFDPAENGAVPYGKLTESSNKKLYGMTEQGGTAGKGILFEYDPATGILTKKSDFDGSKGSKPQGSLLFVCLKPVKPTIALSNGNTELPTLTSSATAGNQWFLNGTAIAGAVNATLNITTVGVYKVQVTLDGCLSDFSNDQSIIVTGDLTTTNPFVEIFPNPVYEWLTVRFGKTAGMKSVALYQLNGVQTDVQETSSDEAKFHIANYGAGVYLVKVKAEGTLKVMRFIKK